MKSGGWARRFLAGLSVGLFALVGLAARGCDRQGSMPQISLGMADSGKTVSVRTGTEVQVDLEDRGTTGYRWSIDAIDDRILAPAGEQSVAYPGIGAGGQCITVVPKLKLVVAHKTDFRGGKPTVSLDEYLALLDDIVGAYCGKCS